MGDTGSMFLGYMFAAISVIGAVKSAATIALIVPILALGLPILDTTLRLYVVTVEEFLYLSQIKDIYIIVYWQWAFPKDRLYS